MSAPLRQAASQRSQRPCLSELLGAVTGRSFPGWGELLETAPRPWPFQGGFEADLVLGAVLNFKDSTFETFENRQILDGLS